MTSSKKDSLSVMLTVMSTFLVLGALTLINPALSKIKEAFPTVPYTSITLLSTMPSLLLFPSILIAGAVVGKKIKYKTLSLLGLVLFTVSGLAPYFTHTNFTLILIERAILGVALGMLYPIGNALILQFYEGGKRANLLGTGVLVKNIGAVFYSFMAGILAAISWSYVFFPYLLAIIPFILIIFFLPEPEKPAATDKTEKVKVKIPLKVWIYSIAYGLITIVIYPVLLNMSSFLKVTGLGNSAIAGTVLSLFTVGGMIGGLIFGQLYKYTKKFIIAIQLLMMGGGIALILYGGNLVSVMIGITLAGFGFFSLQPTVFMIIGMIAQSNAMAFCASVVLSLSSIAVFASSYWIALVGKITGDMIKGSYFLAAVIFGALTVLFIFINPIPKAKEAPINK